mmetsp:Transcript_7875/g.28990  ORF Transcript_7875/g.28990 Transcript_7875/m.28990 type:complete len:330 (+) Transcript_7875:1204-2193(+)
MYYQRNLLLFRATPLTHGATLQHINHVEQRLRILRLNFALQKANRVDCALGVNTAPAHVVLEFKRHRSVGARQTIGVKSVPEQILLRYAHLPNLTRYITHELDVFDIKPTSQIVKRRHDGFGRATGVRLGALMRLGHRQRVPFKRARKLLRHELHRRLKRHNLLTHLRSNNCIRPTRFHIRQHRLSIATSRTHHEWRPVLHVQRRVRVHRLRQRIIHNNHPRILRLGAFKHRTGIFPAFTDVYPAHDHALDVRIRVALVAIRQAIRHQREPISSHHGYRRGVPHLPRHAVHHDVCDIARGVRRRARRRHARARRASRRGARGEAMASRR